ncbi:hypothetical protein Zmor_008974 [Zophobas morio]|jgi:hypothetical protein|uniref:Uncharacterized protein n=1 Tax=Zophobas morio TaxID=2755281 RepID=A0AA38HHM6_9CUCU|nr:hypothetical protein Zmor_008974 [Zophobas morio]
MRDGKFVAGNDVDKETPFSDHLATQGAPSAYLVANKVLCELNSIANAGEQLAPITIVEIVEIINRDERHMTLTVFPTLLKQLPMATTECCLINSTMALVTSPKCWKTATTVMYLKTPRPASTSSKYRPSSLLSAFDKVAEAAILRRLKAFVMQATPCQSSILDFDKGTPRFNNSFA